MTNNLKKAIQNLALSMEKECLEKSSQYFYLNKPGLSLKFCSRAIWLQKAAEEAETL